MKNETIKENYYAVRNYYTVKNIPFVRVQWTKSTKNKFLALDKYEKYIYKRALYIKGTVALD